MAMASANRSILSLCILLLIIGAMIATEAAAPAPAPHRRLHLPTLDDADPSGPPTLPLLQLPPTVAACWKSILASESCANDFLQSLTSLRLHLSKACCSVLEKIGEKCVVGAFSSFPFNPSYAPLVQRICGLTTSG